VSIITDAVPRLRTQKGGEELQKLLTPQASTVYTPLAGPGGRRGGGGGCRRSYTVAACCAAAAVVGGVHHRGTALAVASADCGAALSRGGGASCCCGGGGGGGAPGRGAGALARSENQLALATIRAECGGVAERRFVLVGSV